MLPRSAAVAVANLLPVQPLPQAAMTELHSGLATDVVATGLGANLGEARGTLAWSVRAIAALPRTQLLEVSSLYSTKPVDSSGPDYLNAVALVRTQQTPLAFLQALQALELQAGRERPYRNAPRTLDLDIELWGARQSNVPELILPHPRMWQRAFVLLPLAEIAPGIVSAEQLHSVADQGIERSLVQGWWKS